MSVDYESLLTDEVQEERMLAALGEGRARVVVTVEDQSAELSEHGRHLFSLLLNAPVERVAAIEVLLSPNSEFMSPNDAAEVLGVSRPTVVRWIGEGVLSDHPVGTHHRVERAEVMELLWRRRQEARTAREAAQRARHQLVAAGVDLDAAASAEEAREAGRLARSGDTSGLEVLALRERRAQARAAAEAAAAAAE